MVFIKSRSACARCSRKKKRSPRLELLALNARAAALHHVHHFLKRHLRSVAARRLQKRAVRGAKINDVLRLHAGAKSISNAAGKSIAASDAIFDFQILERARFVKFPLVPKNA